MIHDTVKLEVRMPQGPSQEELIGWLCDDWLGNGPHVCVLEGFGGVGKTRIANEVIRRADCPAIRVVTPEGGLGWEDLLILIATELDEIGENEISSRPDGDLHAGLLSFLRRKCLIVLDNIEALLDPTTGLPPRQLQSLITQISQRTPGPGRFLLITNRSLPAGPWMEDVALHTVYPPDEIAGVQILDNLLSMRGLQEEIDTEKRLDVVRWLGRNPRALEVLVTCLADEPLEQLIQLGSEAWDVRDQVAAPALVKQLEVRLARRSLEHLEVNTKLLLQMISVYRTPFRQDAIDRLSRIVEEPQVAQQLLSKRFFLSRNKSWFSLNPIMREIVRTQLTAEPRRLRVAHTQAADHFTRHFRSQNRSASLLAHGASFVEARYHLLKIGKEEEFEEIAANYRSQLLASYKNITRMPEDSDASQQLISVLMAALSATESGYSNLRYLLARLLMRRNLRDDDLLAYRQVTYATRSQSQSGAWLLRMDLAGKFEGYNASESVARQAIDSLHENEHWIFYRKLILAAFNSSKPQDALRVLNEALQKVQLSQAIPIYSLGAYILTYLNRSSEAIDLLLSGFDKVNDGGVQYSWRLFEQALFLAHGRGNEDALKKVRKSVERIQQRPGYAFLCKTLDLQRAGKWQESAIVAEMGLEACGKARYPTLAAQCAFSWLCDGNASRASAAFADVSFPSNAVTWWIKALSALHSGTRESYVEYMQKYLDRPLAESEVNDEALWIKCWDKVPNDLEPYPAFYFPRLPANLTGLDRDLVRLAERPSPLDPLIMRQAGLPQAATGREQPEGKKFANNSEQVPRNTSNTFIFQGASAPSIVVKGEEYMRDKYEVGQAGAVGPHSKAKDVTIQNFQGSAGEIDLQRLSVELADLRRAMRSASTDEDDPERDVSIAAVAQAQAAATQGDEGKALQHLAKAGRWAWDMANSIGASLAAAVLKTQLGL
ncbi:ATP-binding protein [Streptomyces sp. NPDC002499]